MGDRKLSWFKHGIPYVAKISGDKNGYRLKQTITVFSYGEGWVMYDYPWESPDEPDYDWLSLIDLFYEWDGWEIDCG